jgi:hypothetical protein
VPGPRGSPHLGDLNSPTHVRKLALRAASHSAVFIGAIDIFCTQPDIPQSDISIAVMNKLSWTAFLHSDSLDLN